MANIHTPIPSLKLNDGNSIPMLGYGTGTAWYKSGDESKIDRSLVESIKTAIKLGYRHLDSAEAYKTETELGMAIKESSVEREKLFVTTKVSATVRDIPNAIKNSLRKLQLNYVDLYLIHNPFWAESDADLQKAWAAMEEVKSSGLAKSIGVSNYLSHHLTATLETAKIPPSLNQIEFHPYLQHTSSSLFATHKTHSIATAAYGALTAVTKGAPGPVDATMAALVKKYAVSPGEVSLRWCVDQDVVAITTTAKEQRMSDYLRAMTFKLSPKEIATIREEGEQKHVRAFWKNKFEEGDRS